MSGIKPSVPDVVEASVMVNREQLSNIVISGSQANRNEATTAISQNLDIINNVNGNNGSPGDAPDAKIGDFFNNLGSSASRLPHGVLSVTVDSPDYMMIHPSRGKCIIFNNKKFEPRTQLQERKGTDKDAESLINCFLQLDFEVEKIDDANANDVRAKLREVSRENHSNVDCLIICVLSHGEQGMLWARDHRYPVDELYCHFMGDKCPSLAGKPKLFFIQACQGSNFDRGVNVKGQPLGDTTDAATFYKIPTWADFLIMYSTVPGYYSWRNPSQGSWFIQALTSVLKEHSHHLDLLSMLTLVNRKVAYEFESFCPGQGDFDGNKQVPCITSMLTRRIFFPSIV